MIMSILKKLKWKLKWKLKRVWWFFGFEFHKYVLIGWNHGNFDFDEEKTFTLYLLPFIKWCPPHFWGQLKHKLKMKKAKEYLTILNQYLTVNLKSGRPHVTSDVTHISWDYGAECIWGAYDQHKSPEHYIWLQILGRKEYHVFIKNRIQDKIIVNQTYKYKYSSILRIAGYINETYERISDEENNQKM